MSSVILVVSGTRRPTRSDYARTHLRSLPYDPTYVLQGGCPTGIDKIAREVAAEKGWTTITVHANWSRWGKAAGHRRNTAMLYVALRLCKTTIDEVAVKAFPDPHFSPGTNDLIRKVKELIPASLQLSLEIL